MIKKPLLSVLNKSTCTPPPIWIMRQAGRYLPEYLALRAQQKDFLSCCYTPDIASEITLQPIKRFDLDAAIIFSDILVIPDAMGCDVSFVKGQGPQLSTVTDPSHINDLQMNAEHLSPVYKAITQVKKQLSETTTLIGFAGAPWTLLSYMITGHSIKSSEPILQWVVKHPAAAQQLCQKLEQAIILHCKNQIKAGAEVIQLFDSWSSFVPDWCFTKWCIEPIERIIKSIKADHPAIPIIGFPRGCGGQYGQYIKQSQVDAIAVDQFTNLETLLQTTTIPTQGNLDPVLLANDIEQTLAHVDHIKALTQGRPHIINLGHGILPYTPVRHVEQLIQRVKS